MIKTHYPLLGRDMEDAGRVVWLVRHPLSNIVAQAKWHISGSHTEVVPKDKLDAYLDLRNFRYHMRVSNRNSPIQFPLPSAFSHSEQDAGYAPSLL